METFKEYVTKRIDNTIPQVKEMFKLIWLGVADSMKLKGAIIRTIKSEVLRKNFIHCIFLNGIIFLGTYLIYLYWVSPMLNYLLNHFPTLSNMFTIIYFSLWVYPVYIFSIIANSKWYTEIAKESFVISGRTTFANSTNGILSTFVDEIYRNLLFGVILVMSAIIAFIPYTNFINFVIITWLYSFWCFDYKWILRGKWNLLQRIQYFETHWAYMFGYGLIFTTCSFFFPMLIGNAIFSILYPLFIILSISAKPTKMVNQDGILPKQIPIFYVPEIIVNVILKLYVKYKDLRGDAKSTPPSPTTKQN
ncbi:hypothetical protein ACTFIY_012388 [Dictyostelium cf. discoideum]